MTSDELSDRLATQLGFLERSTRFFDEGFRDEAIRLAVVLRTLFNETRHSTALLARFSDRDVRVLSTCDPIHKRVVLSTGNLSRTVVRVDNGKVTYTSEALLGTSSQTHSFIDWRVWWSEPIYRLPDGDLTRRFIVKTAADQDGGAHIDDVIEPSYLRLKQGFSTIEVHGDLLLDGSGRVPDVHLHDLRQMAFEVLNSSDLLSISGLAHRGA